MRDCVLAVQRGLHLEAHCHSRLWACELFLCLVPADITKCIVITMYYTVPLQKMAMLCCYEYVSLRTTVDEPAPVQMFWRQTLHRHHSVYADTPVRQY